MVGRLPPSLILVLEEAALGCRPDLRVRQLPSRPQGQLGQGWLHGQGPGFPPSGASTVSSGLEQPPPPCGPRLLPLVQTSVEGVRV